MKSYIILLLITLSYFQTHAQQTFEFNEDQFDKIIIVHASGKINIKNTTVPRTSALITKNAVSSKDCESSFEIKDRVLKITTEKKIFVIKSDCTQNFDFFVSANKKLEVSLGVGDINFTGLYNEIAADLGSGQINVQGKVSNLDLDVAAGSVTVAGLDGYGKITLLSGNLDIKYDSPKKKFNQLFVNKSVGNTTIQIPKGSKAESRLKTLMGQISNTIKPSRKGQFYFSVQTNVGDILMNTY
jgi:hypothetical protein